MSDWTAFSHPRVSTKHRDVKSSPIARVISIVPFYTHDESKKRDNTEKHKQQSLTKIGQESNDITK